MKRFIVAYLKNLCGMLAAIALLAAVFYTVAFYPVYFGGAVFFGVTVFATLHDLDRQG